MNRRRWLASSIGCLGAMACRGAMGAPLSMLDGASPDVPMRKAADAFDHILLGVSDLDAGIRMIEERTGVRAKPGGSHPGRGTRNALVSLGRMQYLEIFAPDPAQLGHADDYGLLALASPRIIQWAIHTEDIVAAKRMAEAAGVKTVGPQPGSRQRPDGAMLKWQMLGIETAMEMAPFYIQWEPGSPHPSLDAPLIGQAKSLRFEMPQTAELEQILRGARIEANVLKSNAPRIVLTVETARGVVEFS